MDANESIMALEAVKIRKEAYNALFDALGPGHPATLEAMYKLGLELYFNSDPEAVGVLRDFLEQYGAAEDSLPPMDINAPVAIAAALLAKDENMDQPEAREELADMLGACLSDYSLAWADIASGASDERDIWLEAMRRVAEIQGDEGDWDTALSTWMSVLAKVAPSLMNDPLSQEVLDATIDLTLAWLKCAEEEAEIEPETNDEAADMVDKVTMMADLALAAEISRCADYALGLVENFGDGDEEEESGNGEETEEGAEDMEAIIEDMRDKADRIGQCFNRRVVYLLNRVGAIGADEAAVKTAKDLEAIYNTFRDDQAGQESEVLGWIRHIGEGQAPGTVPEIMGMVVELAEEFA